MKEIDRRAFLAGLPAFVAARPWFTAARRPLRVSTVRGPVDAAVLGTTLVHEHVLVDFVGADKVSRQRYDGDEAFRTVLPHLLALKERGDRTLVECTPAWLGRDPALLRRLSEASGLHIVTNTGYYGAAQHKYLPAHAFDESAAGLEEKPGADALRVAGAAAGGELVVVRARVVRGVEERHIAVGVPSPRSLRGV